MRAALCTGLLVLGAAACEVIRLVPSCDATCIKGRFLASYYSAPVAVSPVHVAAVAPRPMAQVPRVQRASEAPRVTVTATVVQQPVAVPPVHVVQAQAVAARVPSVRVAPTYAATGPGQRPGSGAVPGGEGDALGKIGRRVNMIYTMLVGMRQKYAQPQPRPRIVLVAPVATTTVVKTISLRHVPRGSVSPRAAPVATVTKYVHQQPKGVQEKSPEGKTAAKAPAIPCAVVVPKTQGGGGAKPAKPVKPSEPAAAPAATKQEEDSSSSQDSSDADGDDGKAGRAEKPPYMGTSKPAGKGRRAKESPLLGCYLAENPSRCFSGRGGQGPDIGRAVVYRDDLDSNDEVVYLSDLLWGR